MAVYALWNNKGGVGKSYLTFQIACEYAKTHPDQNILVIDLCPQANASSMILGGIIKGEERLAEIAAITPRPTIAGYMDQRIEALTRALGLAPDFLSTPTNTIMRCRRIFLGRR